MEIKNLTSGNLVSKTMIWDASLPTTIGNSISSYYIKGVTSSVPITFSINNFTYIVGKKYIYRKKGHSVCGGDVIGLLKEHGWQFLEASQHKDLKSFCEENEWNDLNLKTTWVVEENNVLQIVVNAFERAVTWYWGIQQTNIEVRTDEILLKEENFILCRNGLYSKKNNDEYEKEAIQNINKIQAIKNFMFTVFFKKGGSRLIEDYKLFDENGEEPEDYQKSHWKDFHTLVEVYHVDGTMKTGISILVKDIEKIENEPE